MDINSKIGVLGAGIEGIALIEFLVKKGFMDVVLFDEKGAVEDLSGRLAAIGAGAVRVVAGADAFTRFLDGEFVREVLFRSPGIHISRVEEARKRGIKITSTTQYFFENCPCPIIGVTGTKGKGTTSTLIYMMLKEDGRDVYLGGNIGESPLTFIDKLTANSWVVLELSSFQLHDLTISPHVAVVLRVSSDHMDYHKDRAEYVEAKTAIVKFQKTDDICIVNKDYDGAEAFLNLSGAKKELKFLISRKDRVENGAYLGGKGFAIDDDTGAANKMICFANGGKVEEVGEVDKVALLGAHNLENILPSVTAARALGITKEKIQKVIYSFAGLPNRLELVRELKRVKYYNDSFSTTPDTSVSATYAFKFPVILIAGGSEKFSDFTEWGLELQKNKNLKAVFLMGVTAQKMNDALEAARVKIKGEVFELYPMKVYRVAGLKEAITEAQKIASPGDNVVMSPAAASFDQFKNYKERGQKFREWVAELV